MFPYAEKNFHLYRLFKTDLPQFIVELPTSDIHQHPDIECISYDLFLFAISSNDHNRVRLLLENGFIVKSLIPAACKTQNLVLASCIIAVDQTIRTEAYQEQCIYQACKAIVADEQLDFSILDLLKKHGFDFANSEKALVNTDPSVVSKLVSLGANLNTCRRKLPLSTAIQRYRSENPHTLRLIRVLLENGARLDIPDRRGKTPESLISQELNLQLQSRFQLNA